MASTMFGMTGQQINPFGGFGNAETFMQELNKLKSSGVNPNEVIQNLMNSGKISQQQYNDACQKAYMIQQMMGPRG